MNLDRLNTLNLRLTLARRFGFAACWFKRPLSVFKRSGFLRMSGAEFAAMKTMNFDRLTTLNLRLTLQDVFSAPCRFKRPLSVFKRWEFLRKRRETEAMNIDRLNTLI